MFATTTIRKWPFASALAGSRPLHLSAGFSRDRARAIDCEAEADLNRLSLRTLDELDLLFGEGCVTDRGLVECAAQLRGGWA